MKTAGVKSGENRGGGGDAQRRIAFRFIVLLGIVSLFGDITYEGARSITGPYLAVLGAGAAVVGLVAGLGEFIGYALRLVSGYLADRTERYWLITILGYGFLFCVPLLALAGYWQVAALLILLERMGKAVRSPARDAILSHATKQVGRGWGFGIHEALDQVGAIVGPLIFSAVFLLTGSYRQGFRILWIPAILTLAVLLVARSRVPSPEKLEASGSRPVQTIEGRRSLPRVFWLYALFIALSVGGFANFQLISYHLKVQSVVSDTQIPIFYAIAMGVDAVVALLVGKMYDRIGLTSLIAIPCLSLPIPLLAFSHGYGLAAAGIVVWGAAMGIHETIMRAAIGDLTPLERRGFAYGIFNTVYGGAWFLGSTLMGVLYDLSIAYIVLFVIVAEVMSVPVFFLLKREISSAGKRQEEPCRE